MIDTLNLYEKIFQAMQIGTIQAVMDATHKCVGVPILAVDLSYNLLGCSPQTKTGDTNWDYLIENHKLESDAIVDLYNEGVMQSVGKNKAPYIIDWGANEAFPKIQGVIKINNIVEGYVTMLCSREQLTDEYRNAMKTVMEACSLLLKNNGSESGMNEAYQKTFALELFSGQIKTREQLTNWFNTVKFKLEPPFRILTMRNELSNERNVLSYISKSVNQLIPHQMHMILNNVLYVLQYDISDKQSNFEIEKVFGNVLEKFNVICGISNEFANLIDIPIYQKQANDAMEYGIGTVKTKVSYYRDCYLQAILIPRSKEMPECSYISPILEILEKYDSDHTADFALTLKAYINNLCNTTETAKQLNIHRNTLLYRISKIEEITGASIHNYKTFLHLIISFYMIDHSVL